VNRDDTQFTLTRNRDLLALRKHLDQKREWEQEISRLESILVDQTKAARHERVHRLMSLAQKALAVHSELVELDMELLGLRDNKEELERQLAELET
jgi:hypothetical protein